MVVQNMYTLIAGLFLGEERAAALKVVIKPFKRKHSFLNGSCAQAKGLI